MNLSTASRTYDISRKNLRSLVKLDYIKDLVMSSSKVALTMTTGVAPVYFMSLSTAELSRKIREQNGFASFGDRK